MYPKKNTRYTTTATCDTNAAKTSEYAKTKIIQQKGKTMKIKELFNIFRKWQTTPAEPEETKENHSIKLYTMKARPVGKGATIGRIFDITGEETLTTLYNFIVDSFGLEREEEYEFCLNNYIPGDACYKSKPDGGCSTEEKIDCLKLNPYRDFFMCHGSEENGLIFTVSANNIKETEQIIEPTLIKAYGELTEEVKKEMKIRQKQFFH